MKGALAPTESWTVRLRRPHETQRIEFPSVLRVRMAPEEGAPTDTFPSLDKPVRSRDMKLLVFSYGHPSMPSIDNGLHFALACYFGIAHMTAELRMPGQPLLTYESWVSYQGYEKHLNGPTVTSFLVVHNPEEN